MSLELTSIILPNRKEVAVMRRLKYILTAVLVAATAVTIAPVAKTDAPEGCGTKFALVPSDNIGSDNNRLKAVAANGGQVVAAGFYTRPNGRKSALIEVWDGVKMRAIPQDLGGYENEFVWIAANPAGGFKLVATVWTKTTKGLMSKIVVGRFDGQRFSREAVIAVPGAVRNVPHRILVVGSTAWVSGYFTKKFGEPPETSGEIDRPYPELHPYTTGDTETYPLLVQVEGSTWKQVRFPGEGWLDGLASRELDHLIVVGMGRSEKGNYLEEGDYVAVAHELSAGAWRSGEFWPGGQVGPVNKLIQVKAFLDVVLTPSTMVFSYLDIVFNRGYWGSQSGYPHGGLIESTDVASGKGNELPSKAMTAAIKVIIPSLPGHKGVRFYGIARPFDYGAVGLVGQNILYPKYRDNKYPLRFVGEGITTTQTEVWAVGAVYQVTKSSVGTFYEPPGNVSRTAVLRVCPPLQTATAPPTGS